MRQQWRIPILCTVAALLLIVHAYADLADLFQPFFPSQGLLDPAKSLYRRLISSFGTFMVLGVLPAVFGCLLWNERPSDWGFSLGQNQLKKIGLTFLFFLVTLPAIGYAASIPAISADHPESLLAALYVEALLLYEAGVFFFLLGWEMFFRGFLLFGLRKQIGNAAIYVLVIPAVALAAQTSALQAVAAIPMAIFLGHLAVKTESMWYGFFFHFCLLLALDLIVIYRPF